jgi:NADH dehydrogenase/NADH:ubiquinone oxidoreductase subunit G
MAKVWINGQTQVEVADYPGMRAIHLTIDGKKVRTMPGKTILEVVNSRPGIGNIPALCYHPAVKPYGACRLCTVEIEEGTRTRFVAACLYPVKEGLVVKTDTERVRKLRKGILELLLARCPNVKVIQDLAKE